MTATLYSREQVEAWRKRDCRPSAAVLQTDKSVRNKHGDKPGLYPMPRLPGPKPMRVHGKRNSRCMTSDGHVVTNWASGGFYHARQRVSRA